MAQRWHWLRLRTTCHPTEDLALVEEALRNCTGLDEEAFAGVATHLEFDSHYGGAVVIVEAQLERAREIRGALACILQPAVLDQWLAELDARTDDGGVFNGRLSKQRALQGEMKATRSDDAIQIRLKPEVHPASRAGSLAALQAAFSAE